MNKKGKGQLSLVMGIIALCTLVVMIFFREEVINIINGLC